MERYALAWRMSADGTQTVRGRRGGRPPPPPGIYLKMEVQRFRNFCRLYSDGGRNSTREAKAENDRSKH